MVLLSGLVLVFHRPTEVYPLRNTSVVHLLGYGKEKISVINFREDQNMKWIQF